MRDVNTSLSKAYFTALTGITYDSVSVPVYSGILPDNLKAYHYIIFGEVSNNDLSTKSTSDTSTLMRVTIHTYSQKYNSSIPANFLANQIFERIYPDSQFNLSLDNNLQCVSTELQSDNTSSIKMENGNAFVDRFLIFRHKIYHRDIELSS